jgi:hypothetical protein
MRCCDTWDFYNLEKRGARGGIEDTNISRERVVVLSVVKGI